MKKIIKYFVVLVIVIGTNVVVKANDPEKTGSDLTVIQKNKEIYNVVYKGKGEQELVIQFLDKDARVLYNETVQSNNGFSKYLDLSGLPCGSYAVKLVSKEDTLTESVIIKSAQEKFGTHVNLKELGSKQYMILIDEEVDESFDLYIKDSKGEMLYQGDIKSADKKVYDLKELLGTEATFIIYDGTQLVKESLVRFL